MAANPYLSSQADAIASQATNNLTRNILPTMRRSAVAQGGWGNSGNGIREGLAIGDTQQGITNSVANLYGNAYEGDQNRATQMSLGQLQADTSRYGIDTGASTARMNDATNRYGMDQSYALGLGGLQNARDISQLNNETSRYGIDANTGLGYAGLANTRDISLLNNQTQRLGMDQNYALGLGGLDVSRQNANTNAASVANQYDLGQGQLDLSGMRLGMDMFGNTIDNTIKVGDALYTSGQRELNAPMGVNAAYGNTLGGLLGTTGGSTSTGPATGGGFAGAVGGALTAEQLYRISMGLAP